MMWTARTYEQESDLAARHRTDSGKLAITALLRKETTLPIKWIAARVKSATLKGAKAVLHRLTHDQPAGCTESSAQTGIPIYGLTLLLLAGFTAR
jgi:hypothetical protein